MTMECTGDPKGLEFMLNVQPYTQMKLRLFGKWRGWILKKPGPTPNGWTVVKEATRDELLNIMRGIVEGVSPRPAAPGKKPKLFLPGTT